MPDILIIGGGFAGVWSAAAAVRVLRAAGAGERHRVTLVAPGDDLVLKPRLYEPDPGTMRVALDRTLGPIGVRRVPGTVTSIDTEAREAAVTLRDGGAERLPYDRLILATGSHLRRPDIAGGEHLHDIDTIEAAERLDAHLRALPTAAPGPGRFTVAVVGAGFTGIEAATELATRIRTIAAEAGATDEASVVLIEREPVVGPDLGPGPRPEITAALTGLGVDVRLGQGVRGADPGGLDLADGTRLPARTVVWTAGIAASPLTRDIPGERDELGRLRVGHDLSVNGLTGVYAAGDTAAAPVEDGHVSMPSCQHAMPLGRFAGHNAAADLLGLPPAPFRPDPYVTCLDLGAAGALLTRGWDRTVHTTGEPAKLRKRTINGQWIVPPMDDAEEILRRADHRVSTRAGTRK